MHDNIETDEVKEEVVLADNPTNEAETIEKTETVEHGDDAKSTSSSESSKPTLEDSGFGGEMHEMEYAKDRNSFQKNTNKSEKTTTNNNFFSRNFSFKDDQSEDKEDIVEENKEELPPKMVITPADNEPIIDNDKKQKLTTSSFLINNFRNGVPQILFELSKIRDKKLKKYPQKYHPILKQASEKLNENNKDAFVIPEWHINNIEPALADFLIDKNAENSLPSWLPLGVGLGFFGYWAFSTVLEVQKKNEDSITRLIVELEEKKLVQSQTDELASKLSKVDDLTKSLQDKEKELDRMMKNLKAKESQNKESEIETQK